MFNLKISLSLVLIRLVYGRDLQSFKYLLGCLNVLKVAVFVLSSGFTRYASFFHDSLILTSIYCSLMLAAKRVCNLTIVRVVMADFCSHFQII